MSKDLVNVRFVFPDVSDVQSGSDFVDYYLQDMKTDSSIDYAGYLSEDDLRRDLKFHIGEADPKKSSEYQLTSDEQNRISKIIENCVDRCNEELPHNHFPIFVFVFPWFSKNEEYDFFHGTMGVAPFFQSMHLFITPHVFTEKSLAETIAHEYNHLVFQDYHGLSDQNTLLDHIVMEGFAEVFREEVVGGKPAPWSVLLTRREAEKKLKELESLYEVKGFGIYSDIFHGSDMYPRWTGYSIGYRLVKDFRAKNFNMKWKNLMILEAKEILSVYL